MPYLLTLEVQNSTAVEHFKREFDNLLDAKRYAHNQARGDIYWTVREDHLEGLAPSYAFRIEATGEDMGKPLDVAVGEAEEEPAPSASLYTPEGPVEDSRCGRGPLQVGPSQAGRVAAGDRSSSPQRCRAS